MLGKKQDLNRPQVYRACCQGFLTIMAAPLMIVLVAMTALAVDIGRIMVARNALQNAADAAALAGAARLGSYVTPSWALAEASARAAIRNNQVFQQGLTAGEVLTGFWPVHGHGALRPHNSSPLYPLPGENPGVMVTIRLSAQGNGGPMTLFFAPIFGRFVQDVSATAVGVVTTPGFAAEGTLFPMVLNKCLFDANWENNAPKYPDMPIRIGSAYHNEGCAVGQWTSLNLFSQSARVAKDLVETGNTLEITVEDDTYIQSGTEASIYKVVQAQIDATEEGYIDVLMPVVDKADLTVSGPTPIVAFAPFRILRSEGGNDKYIEGKFIPNFKAEGTSGGVGGGAFYGATTPAILAK